MKKITSMLLGMTTGLILSLRRALQKPRFLSVRSKSSCHIRPAVSPTS
jgi:hypothetical protein